MSDEECRDGRPKDLQMSPSCSSFEAQDPHDPVISRLATHLFRKTNDYLQGEITAGQDHYCLLEEINRLTITKYTDIRSLAVNVRTMLNEYNGAFTEQMKPLLQQIDAIESQVSVLENQAYRIDSYTKQLLQRFKELEQR